MKLTIATAIGASAAIFAAGALANHHKGDAEGWHAKVEAHFAEVDGDKSGGISEEEFVAYKVAKAKEKFAAMAGEDSSLSLDEVKAHHQAKMAEKQAKMKAYKDGKAEADAEAEVEEAAEDGDKN